MSRISMDTDNVRAVSSRMRQTADSLDASLSSINQTVKSAGWQSQAREEFIIQLDIVSKSAMQSTTTLRLMAKALDEKANQWEVVGNVFNGPFYHIKGIWASVMNSMGEAWTRICNMFNFKKLPSVPAFLMPSTTGAAVLGASTSLISKPKIERPSWWPFKVGENEEIIKDKVKNLEMQRDYTKKELDQKQEEYDKYISKVNELGKKIRETDLWKPFKNLLKNSTGYDVDDKDFDFTKLIGIIVKAAKSKESLLIPFLGGFCESVYQNGKLLYYLSQMTKAYNKSQIVSSEIIELKGQLNNLDNQIASFEGN